jgi:hypothetical protein
VVRIAAKPTHPHNFNIQSSNRRRKISGDIARDNNLQFRRCLSRRLKDREGKACSEGEHWSSGS